MWQVLLQLSYSEGVGCVCRVFGNLVTIDISALPAKVNTTYIHVCGDNCSFVEYLDMVEFVPGELCNASCAANEVSWAASNLMLPVNVSACNSDCQRQHEAFMSRSQSANVAMLAPAQAPAPEAINSQQHRKLQEYVLVQLPYSDCHGDNGQLCAPQWEENTPACWENEAECKNCPVPAADHPEVNCWVGVYVDLSGTPDSRTCTNCADAVKMADAVNAANNNPGNSGSINWGQVITGALQVAIALG